MSHSVTIGKNGCSLWLSLSLNHVDTKISVLFVIILIKTVSVFNNSGSGTRFSRRWELIWICSSYFARKHHCREFERCFRFKDTIGWYFIHWKFNETVSIRNSYVLSSFPILGRYMLNNWRQMEFLNSNIRWEERRFVPGLFMKSIIGKRERDCTFPFVYTFLSSRFRSVLFWWKSTLRVSSSGFNYYRV